MPRLTTNPVPLLLHVLLGGAISSPIWYVLFTVTALPHTLAQGPGGQPGFGGARAGGSGGRVDGAAFPPEGPGGGRRAQQCVVLYNGETFYGRLTTRGLNYMVAQANGELVIPFTQVRVVAESTEEAYAQLRRAIKDPTVDQVVWLAQWSQKQGLQEESRQLCEVVLKAEPSNEEALRLWKMVQSPRDPRVPQTRTNPAASEPIVLTAAGISPEASAYFIRRIQPILVNSCAHRGCHSSDSEQEFRLSAYRLTDGPRYRSKENLAETLKKVSLSDPERSPLLPSTRGAEHHSKVFDGPGGTECRKQLEAWVVRVALEQSLTRQMSEAADRPLPPSIPAPNSRSPGQGSRRGE